MTKDTGMRVHRIFNIIVASFAGIAGACLMAACLIIYYGRGEYSREIVAEVFGYFAVPVYAAIALIVAGLLYELISPLKAKKEKPSRDYGFIRAKLLEKKNFSECDKALAAAIKKERVARNVHAAVRASLAVVCAAVFLAYGANPANFDSVEITDSMIGAMMWLAPCLFVSGGYAVFASFFNERSVKREIELLKKLPDAREDAVVRAKKRNVSAVVVTVLRIVFVCAGIAILVYGALEGGFADVMTKAVNICTECIGLG